MKKVLLILVIVLLNSPANAGFWTSLAGGVVANSLTSSGASSNGVNIDAKADEKKVQQVLIKLGFYNTNIDGNLNSFETRNGIKQFQKYYLSEPTGTLETKEIQDMLYMHDLFKNYKQEWKYPKEQDSAKILNIYHSFDKFEDKIRNRNASYLKKAEMLFSKPQYLSTKLKKEMETRRKNIRDMLTDYGFKGYPKDIEGIYFDKYTKLVWSDNNDASHVGKLWIDAMNYCENLSLASQKDWYLPSIKQLEQLYKQKNSLQHVASYNTYWSSSEYVSDSSTAWSLYFGDGNINWNKKFYKYYVRCVRGKQ